MSEHKEDKVAWINLGMIGVATIYVNAVVK